MKNMHVIVLGHAAAPCVTCEIDDDMHVRIPDIHVRVIWLCSDVASIWLCSDVAKLQRLSGVLNSGFFGKDLFA